MARGVPKNGVNRGWFKRGVTQSRSDAHRKAIGEAQRNAWSTKRKRLPVGSTWIDRQGYVRVKTSEPCTYWRPEHLIVAEKKLGRALLAGEVVHHINVRPADNAEENLHVFANKTLHSHAHASILGLIKPLLEAGAIRFDAASGAYVLCR